MNSKETVLQALETSLQSFFEGGAATNQIASRKIKRWKRNMLTQPPSETPSITIVDAGESIPEVSDASYVRYLLVVHLDMLVKLDSKDDMLEGLNNVIAAVQKFCDTNQVGGDCIDVKLRSIESIQLYPDKNMADASAILHLRYLRTNGGV